MKRTAIFRLIFGLALAAVLATADDKKANVLLQGAMAKETVQGDLKGAIALYQSAVKEAGANRALVAKALVHMAECYQKLGDAQSSKIYEQLVGEYSDQKEAVATARARLGASGVNNKGIVTRQVWTGEKLQGSVSQDGRYISFTKWPDIALHDLTKGTDRKLTEGSFSYPPSVISPDGKYVAYACTTTSWSVCVIATEPGAKPRGLYSIQEYFSFAPKAGAWSPDGKLVFATLFKTDGTALIASVSVADGSIRVLKSLEWRRPGRPTLSPDGRYVAYSAHERADSQATAIYVLKSDGSGESTLVQSSGLNQDPVWTPDGSRIVFTSNRSGSFDLWSIAVHEGKSAGAPVLAKADIGKMQPLGFTRSGSFFYNHIQGGTDVLIADLEPSETIKGAATRVSDQFVGANRDPSWSPDGKFIAFKRFVWDTMGNAESGPGPDLVVRSLETGEEKTLSNLPSNRWMVGPAIWFRDGKSLLQPVKDQQAQTSYYRVDLASGQFKLLVTPERFVQGYGSAALSPDETTLYVPVLEGGLRGKGGVAAIDLATGRETPIFMTDHDPGTSNVPNLALSPDGRTLAMLEFVNHVLGISLVNVDGSSYHRLHAAGPSEISDAGTLAWSKDGHSILFGGTVDGNWGLMRIAVTGGKPEFAGLAGKGAQLVHRISLSPDGSRIAVGDGERETVEVWALDNLLPVLKAAR